MPASELIVGLMSGTSLDGADAVLVDFASGTPHVRATAHFPYSADLRRELLGLHVSGSDELHRTAMLGQRLARIYADAVFRVLAHAGVSAGEIRAIGCHGQTLRHQPALGYSIQLNNPALLVELTGICVVADFRSRDIAAGGQGAPLVPAFHDALFRDASRHRAILNIGGIANLTDLEPGRPVRGFDCGPGNMLLDAWTQRHLGQDYDDGGRWAASGQPLSGLLDRLLAHPFFAEAPPKSCGREQFNLAWLDNLLTGTEAPADVQATLLALTVTAVQRAVRRWCGAVDDLHVCGGGARNSALMKKLAGCLPGVHVATTDDLGLPSAWVEAVAFAWLARRTLEGLTGSLAEVTGARNASVLGAIYPA